MPAPGSPRIQSGARPTLSNLGAFMPRPAHQPSCSASSATVRSPRAPITARGERPRRGHAEVSMQWPSSMTVGSNIEGLTQQKHMICNKMASPRLSPRMPNTARCDISRPVTLGNIGSLLQRPPQGQPQSSPRLSPREVRPQQCLPIGASPRLPARRVQGEPDTRSGVVYERDGFELFYGVGGGAEDETAPRARAKPDGFDKFYGIRSHDKQPAGRESSQALSSSQAGYPNQLRAPEASSSLCLTTSACLPPKVLPPGPNVPTFSVSTPVPSYIPPVDAAVPKGVDVFSVATPMPPPPSVPMLNIS